MKTTFRIEGLRELDAALGELPKATARSVLVRTLILAGEPIREAAQAAAPERPAGASDKYFTRGGAKNLRRPGTLRALVQIGARLTKRQGRDARKAGKDFAEVYIGTRDPVGRLEEFGTAHAGARPYLRPAWEAGKMQALEVIKAELGRQIEVTAQRLARKAARLAAKGG